jgi:hypothetical protein
VGITCDSAKDYFKIFKRWLNTGKALPGDYLLSPYGIKTANAVSKTSRQQAPLTINHGVNPDIFYIAYFK